MMKKIVLALVALAVVLSLAPLALSPNVQITRTVEIQAPVEKVHAYLADLNQYSAWNPFQEADPNQRTQIQGTGVGSFLTWQGEKTGEGKMTIAAIEPNQVVRLDMEFYSPMKGEGVSIWKTETNAQGLTQMTWSYEQALPYFQRYFSFMMNSMMGGHFEKGLASLKKRMESQ